MKEDQKCKKNDFWGVFLAWPPFVENALFTLLNELKMVKIQNLPIMRPKVVNESNKHLLHHFGGMLA